MSGWLAFLLPWEFSPLAVALVVGAAVAFVRGARRAPPGQEVGVARRIGFFAGLALLYFVMQTHYDYLSQHMFYIHRLQHLVLHHAGPFLIALSQPQAVIARGLPQRLHDRVLAPAWRHPLRSGPRRLRASRSRAASNSSCSGWCSSTGRSGCRASTTRASSPR